VEDVEDVEERVQGVPRWLMATVVGGVVGVALLVTAFVAKGLYVEWLWFESLGQGALFFAMTRTGFSLFLLVSVVTAGVLAVNLWLARRLATRRWAAVVRAAPPAADDAADGDGRAPRDPTLLLAGFGVLVALLLGWWASGHWAAVLRLPHATPFGQSDPLFGRDVGFYVFALPVLQAARTWALWATGLTLVGVAVVYFARLVLPQSVRSTPLPAFRAVGAAGEEDDAEAGEPRLDLALGGAVRAHLSLLGALLCLVLVGHFRLRQLELVLSGRGTTYGAGYTDVQAVLPALWVLLAVAAAGAVALAVGALLRGPWIGAGLLGTFAVVWLGGTVIVPGFVQRFQVAPNELERERPYITRNIEATRRAYGLDRVQEADFAVAEAVSRQEVEANPATLRNVRLWDYEPLLATYNQIQSIRGYYGFLDADFDRYVVDGEYRQVMIAGRELTPERLPADAQTWVNRRLQFTHGYGVVVSPVNEATPEGLPTLIVQDVPPRGKLAVSRPELYYGESRADWVVVKTAVPEFDYPRGADNAESTYQGEGGVGVGSFARRLLFAWHLTDLNVLISPALRPDSRLLFHRNVHERVRKVAPFLLFDTDPYLVVDEGRLVWLYDAYTHSRHYPYAQPVTGAFNYLRNSVKVTVDAYDGSLAFYVADPADPLVRAYSGAFPGLFRPLEDMPAGLRAHIRYPGTLFAAQAQMYRLYHTQDPRVFYQREDQLSVPGEMYLLEERPVPVRPYYAIMRLPGAAREEFVYILPFTPPGKDNMITWLAARSDGADYGTLVAYKYPKETLIFGPLQVEARINQDPTISAQFTLWNQGGTRVLRGNMLAIPIGRSNLYVEPIYLQAGGSRLPELKRVVVATGNRVAMGESVDDALAQLYGGPLSYAPISTTTAVAAATGPPALAPPAAQPLPAPPPPPGLVPGEAPPAAGALSAAERTALVEAVRSLQQRNQRLQQEQEGLQDDLRRLLEAVERAPPP
jgi:uncharacterized membrane protein (UPF0182 family)